MAPSLKSVTVVTALGILLIFFFPASFGSFTSTHGPATALRALNAIRSIFSMLAEKALFALLSAGFALSFSLSVLPAPQRDSAAAMCLRC